ncbi:hypothetical protein M407DRAFT_21898 [Tulasnella calospora MUT 4182]|uniref:Protein kinase domain-containing protein n=1 Tax=Tulasnella calospora MUT 4182 TaxID=1051891 RepID=A0A0C3M5R7_9AGAM|nr:hypothetical protein M407DRAFT_21898 [Tulasnella calospora MUT 4182]
MQNEEHSPADAIHVPEPIHEGSTSGVQLSANMTRRLEKLERWRIDPSLIKLPDGAPKFEGGYAIVSRALLVSPSDDTEGQLVESNVRTLMSSLRVSNADGNEDRQEMAGGEQEGKPKDEVPTEGEDQGSDGETSTRPKAVAVKKMKVKARGDGVRVLGLALREAEVLVKLSHPNIIRLEGFVEDVSREVVSLVFPWEDNGTLKDFVALHDWEIPERISLIFDVANGVEYLHSRTPPICHGDLKSINILVNSKCRAVITDFGSAHHPVAKDLNKERERASEEPESAPSLEATLCPSTNTITLTCKHYTVRWAAPELLEEEESSLASDIWALGWVAYEVMTNSIPFHDVKEAVVINLIVRGDLPTISNDVRMLLIQELCSVVGRCWTLDPSKRPAAKDCRESISWMPGIAPNPMRAGDAAGFMDRSAELLMKLGYMHRRQSDYPNASNYYNEALGVYTDLADSQGKANALEELAQIHRFQQEYSQAVKSYTEALKIYTDIGDRKGKGSALWGLAEVHRLRNEYSQAVAFYSECLQIRIDIADRQGRAEALWGLASVHRFRNEYSQAVAFYSECLQIRTDIGDRFGRAEALWGLAEVHRLRNEYSQAVAFYSECLQIRTDIGDRQGRAEALIGLADMHRVRNEYSQAVAFYSECLQIQTEIGGRQGRAEALWSLAEVHRLRKEYIQAMTSFSDALTIFTDLNHRYWRAFALRGIGDTHCDQDDRSSAVHYYEQAAKIFKELGNTPNEAVVLKRAADVRRLMEQKVAT